MYLLDKDAILNSLTEEDIIKIVIKLGSGTPKRDADHNPIFQTICHNQPNPNNSWKLYYYTQSRRFHCYTKCSENFDIVELVIRANRTQGKTITWYKALRWIGQFTGKLIETEAKDITTAQCITDFEWINRIKAAQKGKRSAPTLSEISENILELFCYHPHELWLNDNISTTAMNRYEIGYYGLTNQIIIPHRDKNGRLIGIRGRYLDQEDINLIGKYVPLQIEGKFLSHSLGSNLYGLHVVKDRIMSLKKVMLVEGEKSCLQAYSYFGEDSFVVATCGSAITRTQIKILLTELGVNEVIYAPDRDYHDPHSYEAQIWWNKQVKKLAALVPYVKTTLVVDGQHRLDYKDSPTDKGKDVLLELLDEKVVITAEDVKRAQEKIEFDTGDLDE